MDSLDARDVLPLMDVEIRSLYLQAQESFPDLRPSGEIRSVSAKWLFADLLVYSLIAGLILMDGQLFPLVFILIAIAIAGISMAGLKSIGLFSWFGQKYEHQSKQTDIDINDRKVLTAVVRLLTTEPDQRYKQLSQKISVSRNRIASSLETLAKLIDELVVEGTSSSDSISLLRRSRLEQAERSRSKLSELDYHLASQLIEAKNAIAPLHEMERSFHKMLQISDDLTKIQAAHGLIEETEANLIENRQEIQLLRTISQNALGCLRSIEQDVKSREIAEDEVLKLRA